MANRVEQAKALAHDSRLKILGWLTEPRAHFAHQLYADPVDVGVCVTMLTEKLGASQPTVSRHLDLLRRADFISVNKVERWSFYRRNEEDIADYKTWLATSL
jgi:ArsR family transcriptional regulator